jgi:hypothetical protein
LLASLWGRFFFVVPSARYSGSITKIFVETDQ